MTSVAFSRKEQRHMPDVKDKEGLLHTGLLYLLFLPLPIIDSLNGMLNGGGNDGILSLGMMYRLCIIVCSCFVIVKGVIPKRSLAVFIAIVAFIGIPHAFDFADALFLSLTTKTLLPILCIEAFAKKVLDGSLTSNHISRLLDSWAILFPLAILIPFVLGFGFQTYGSEEVGYKGYFYAQNDLCFVLSVLFFFCCGNIFRRASFANAVKLLLVGICIVLLGLKSGYILLVVSIVYWIARSEMPLMKRFGIVLAVCLAALMLIPFVSEAVSSIINRWMYFSVTKSSFLDFFSSGRLERIPIAIDYLFANEANPAWFIFGVGMRYGECLAPYGLIEMDPFDLFFQYGLIGSVFLLVYYSRFLFLNLPNSKSHYRFVLLVAFAVAVAAGHVLNSALSGMVFSVLCCAVVAADGKAVNTQKARNDK